MRVKKTKISIIKLNNIKCLIKTAKTLAFRGCHVVSLCFKPRIISKNKKETFKPKIKQITQQLKCCLYLQNQQIFMPLGHDRQPTVSRSLLVRFSLTSRQVLVRLSFVSRCLVVSLSKTERGPNEEQAKNERKSNEYRSSKQRETIENSTKYHHHGWQNPSATTNQQNAFCLKSAEAEPCTSSPH